MWLSVDRVVFIGHGLELATSKSVKAVQGGGAPIVNSTPKVEKLEKGRKNNIDNYFQYHHPTRSTNKGGVLKIFSSGFFSSDVFYQLLFSHSIE